MEIHVKSSFISTLHSSRVFIYDLPYGAYASYHMIAASSTDVTNRSRIEYLIPFKLHDKFGLINGFNQI